MIYVFFFFNDAATTEIYTLSLHDALPIYGVVLGPGLVHLGEELIDRGRQHVERAVLRDRKSTRLNSSHSQISYADFCLKKKNKLIMNYIRFLMPTNKHICNITLYVLYIN